MLCKASISNGIFSVLHFPERMRTLHTLPKRGNGALPNEIEKQGQILNLLTLDKILEHKVLNPAVREGSEGKLHRYYHVESSEMSSPKRLIKAILREGSSFQNGSKGGMIR